MPSRTAAVALSALALSLVACGDDPEPPRPPFSFVAVAGMACADGSPTGIGLSRGTGDNVLVVLSGGGACWSGSACDASRGPFGHAELALAQAALLRGTILDRGLPGNPFAGFTMVLVPYCTGDVHAGDRDTVHAGVLWRHRGRRNLAAAVGWLGASLPRPAHVVVAGSSAGGFGTLLAHDLVRAEWPPDGAGSVSAALVDDSGPTFDATALPSVLRSAWWDAWNLGSTLDPGCAGCRDDLSAIWEARARAYPDDRFALLSTTADATMRAFYGQMTGADFAAALDRLAGRIDALPHGAVFRVDGPRATDHALLLAPGSYAAGGTPLLEWLRPLAGGGGDLSSRGP